VEETLLHGASSGPRFGYPLAQARIRVVGAPAGGSHDSELGYVQAAAQALRQAMEEAGIELLEPVMAFDISAPSEFMSGIIAELNSKRADIADLKVDGDVRTVVGEVPLASMFGYSTTLRSLSQGRASFSLQPAGFRPVTEPELVARGLTWS
jgi:elongation factor G